MTTLLQSPTHHETHAENPTGAPKNSPKAGNSMELPSPEVKAVIERIRK